MADSQSSRALPLTREQIEVWRRCCLSHWISELTNDESVRQANALCDMALSALSETPPSMSDVLRQAAGYLKAHGKPTLAGDCRTCATVIDELRRAERSPRTDGSVEGSRE